MKPTLSLRCGPVAPARPLKPSTAVKRVSVVARVALPDEEGLWREVPETAAERFDRLVKKVDTGDYSKFVAEGWTVLDVRPPHEVEKVKIDGSMEVPFFVQDTHIDPFSLVKRVSAFGMCGWWHGGMHMVRNEQFLDDVVEKVHVDTKVLLTCQQGLRSKAAAEELVDAGYKHVAWVKGGLDSAKAGDVPAVDGKDVREAGIGGIAAFIHWTPFQQENVGPLGGFRTIIAVIFTLWLINVITLSYELSPLWTKMLE